MSSEPSRFGLTRLVLGETRFIEIDAAEFEEIRKAREGVFGILGLEEKLDLVVENYSEFERDLLEMALRHSLSSALDWSSSMNELQRLNRRLANLLMSTRLYVDQTAHGLSKVFGRGSPQFRAFRESLEEQARISLGHRVMSAVRNHAQHSNLPIHSLVYSGSSREEKEGRFLVFVTVPKTEVSRLEEDRDRELKPVVEELRAFGEVVDLRPLVREHVQSILAVHENVRRAIAAEEARWLKTLEDTVARGTEAFGGEVSGLSLVEQDERGDLRQRAGIFREPIERLSHLRRKNPCAGSLSFQYVSGKAAAPHPGGREPEARGSNGRGPRIRA